MLHASLKHRNKWTSFFGKLSFTLGSLCGRMVEIHIWIMWMVDELRPELLECACLLRMAAHSSRSQLAATTSQNHVRHTPKHPETHLRIRIYQLYLTYLSWKSSAAWLPKHSPRNHATTFVANLKGHSLSRHIRMPQIESHGFRDVEESEGGGEGGDQE